MAIKEGPDVKFALQMWQQPPHKCDICDFPSITMERIFNFRGRGYPCLLKILLWRTP